MTGVQTCALPIFRYGLQFPVQRSRKLAFQFSQSRLQNSLLGLRSLLLFPLRTDAFNGQSRALRLQSPSCRFHLLGLLFTRRKTEHEREQCQHAADYKLSLAVARKMNPTPATHE